MERSLASSDAATEIVPGEQTLSVSLTVSSAALRASAFRPTLPQYFCWRS
jgi:hypothetical protein